MLLEEIENKIVEIIKKDTRREISDYNQNLLSSKIGIVLPDFLYVFADMEKTFAVPCFAFLEEYPYSDFTVVGLAKAVAECLPD